MASSTLQTIRTKIRRLTRSLSPSQISDDNIDQYINTFVQYDFPEHLRLFNFQKTFTFYTQPFIDVYETSNDVNSPMYNFKNKYVTVNPPVFVAGYQAQFLQSREQLFGQYPMINSIASVGTTGNGTTAAFSGTINQAQANTTGISGQITCLIRENVLFSSIDSNDNGLAMIDYPISATIGNLYVPGTVPTSTVTKDVNNFINYVTGQYKVTFIAAPGIGQQINSQTIPTQAALPTAVLFYDGKFTVRPVPDQPYRINIEVEQRPSELLSSGQSPDLEEFWQLIAYGASKKIFEDRMDLDSVQQILPEFNMQLRLCLRRTIVQQTSQRVSSIYTESTGGMGSAGNGWSGGSNSF